MALREIRILGDPVLEKTSREIKEITPRIQDLIMDMLETMYDANGVGLAAVQVGVLRRLVVIDCGIDPETGEDAEYGECAVVMINPRIVETSGEQTGDEGCLSYPGKAGCVTRPNHVKAVYLDEDMNECEIVGEGLLARAICHELDHLDGHMYVEKVEGEIHDVHYEDPADGDEE